MDNRERWRLAVKGAPGSPWQTIVPLVVPAAITYGALVVAGSSDGAVDHLITVAVAVTVSVLFWTLRVTWAYLRVPIKQLEKDVAALRADMSRLSQTVFAAPGSVLPPGELLSILLQLKNELDGAKVQLVKVIRSGRYWKMSEGGPREDAWKRYSDLLSRQPGLGVVYLKTAAAYDQIRRLRQVRAPRWTKGEVKSEDDVPNTLRVVEDAFQAVDERIAQLESPHLPGTG